jgi:hypothetical protein
VSLSFQSENWADIVGELKPLIVLQWEEIALDRDSIPLDPDWDRYAALSAAGSLKITTARDSASGELAGWYLTVVSPHPHYKSTLFGFLDIYYIRPEYRRGLAGLGLFAAMEKSMRALGVKELISISKTHRSVEPIFERLDWRETGTTYTKVLS